MARKFDPNAAFIPFYGNYLALKNVINNSKTNGFQFKDLFGAWKESEESDPVIEESQRILGEVANNSRQQFLDDREHTEMREDTAYQRAVSDMRKAGLNPYTIGASGAPSSASTVGENQIATKLQMLGYVLDLKNLDAKNRSITNNAIGTIIKAIV